MKRPKHITRFEYGRTRGWWVRIERVGFFRRQLFSDSEFGGKRAALKAAEKYRDWLIARAPESKKGAHTADVLLNRQGNLKRIERLVYSRGNRKPYYVEAWVAWIKVSPYRLASTNWSIEKWGVREAKRRALLWLERAQKVQRKNYRALKRGRS